MRQLENAIFRAVVLADGDELGVAEFPQVTVQMGAHASPDTAAAQPLLEAAPAMMASWPESRTVPEDDHASALAPTPASLRLVDLSGDVRPLDDIEREVIRFAIAHYRGQMSEVARRLQIGRSTLYRKLEGLGLDGDAAADKKEDAPTE